MDHNQSNIKIIYVIIFAAKVEDLLAHKQLGQTSHDMAEDDLQMLALSSVHRVDATAQSYSSVDHLTLVLDY